MTARSSVILGGHGHDPCRTPTRHRAFRPPCHAGGRPARSRRRAGDPRRARARRPTPSMRWCRPRWCRTRRSGAPMPASRSWRPSSARQRAAAPGRLPRQHARQHLRPPRRAARLGAERAAGRCADGRAASSAAAARMGGPGPRPAAWAVRATAARPDAAAAAEPGRGGSFLGTAAAAAAGVIGGSLLLDSIRGMTGGSGERPRPRRSGARAGGDGGGSPLGQQRRWRRWRRPRAAGRRRRYRPQSGSGPFGQQGQGRACSTTQAASGNADRSTTAGLKTTTSTRRRRLDDGGDFDSGESAATMTSPSLHAAEKSKRPPVTGGLSRLQLESSLSQITTTRVPTRTRP